MPKTYKILLSAAEDPGCEISHFVVTERNWSVVLIGTWLNGHVNRFFNQLAESRYKDGEEYILTIKFIHVPNPPHIAEKEGA